MGVIISYSAAAGLLSNNWSSVCPNKAKLGNLGTEVVRVEFYVLFFKKF